MQNRLDEKVNKIIEEAQKKTDDELDNEIRIYIAIKAAAVHTEVNFFRRIVAFFSGERHEIEEHRTNVTESNSLAEEIRNNKNDEARINTVRNLFRNALAYFTEAKHRIEHHWNHVINSNTLSSELGYKELLDEAMDDLKTCNRIKIELNKIQDEYSKIQDEYNDAMGKNEIIKIHNKTIGKEIIKGEKNGYIEKDV